MERRKSREVSVGNLKIGNNHPIRVQSMTKTLTTDVEGTIKQILELEEAGCEIIRCAVPDMDSAKALGAIKKGINIPLVADIHFDYRLALESAKHVDKLRINPGNIGGEEKVKAVVDAAKNYNLPIRIGVNSGSVEKHLVEKYGVTAQAMVESAMNHIKLLENQDFENIIVSLKATDINKAVDAYKLLATKVDYPFHLGITESGRAYSGIVKTSAGLGALLQQGLGDTLRVSLTEDPKEEVKLGHEILQALDIRQRTRVIISCPTCGRVRVNLMKIAKEIEEKTAHITKPIKIAVMGCVVNGPGESKEADIGVACGIKRAVIFKKGKVVKTVDEDKIVEELLKEIDTIEV